MKRGKNTLLGELVMSKQKPYRARVKAFCLNCGVKVQDGIIESFLPGEVEIKCPNDDEPNPDGHNYHLVLVHHEIEEDVPY